MLWFWTFSSSATCDDKTVEKRRQDQVDARHVGWIVVALKPITDLCTRHIFVAESKDLDHLRVVKIKNVPEPTENVVVGHDKRAFAGTSRTFEGPRVGLVAELELEVERDAPGTGAGSGVRSLRSAVLGDSRWVSLLGAVELGVEADLGAARLGAPFGPDIADGVEGRLRIVVRHPGGDPNRLVIAKEINLGGD